MVKDSKIILKLLKPSSFQERDLFCQTNKQLQHSVLLLTFPRVTLNIYLNSFSQVDEEPHPGREVRLSLSHSHIHNAQNKPKTDKEL